MLFVVGGTASAEGKHTQKITLLLVVEHRLNSLLQGNSNVAPFPNL